MWMKRISPKQKKLREYDREMLRSAFVSLFWNVITYRKEIGGFKLKTLADKIGVNKSAPTRWFSSARPNWTINTISDIADALDVEISIQARARDKNIAFTPYGLLQSELQAPAKPITTSQASMMIVSIDQTPRISAVPAGRVPQVSMTATR